MQVLFAKRPETHRLDASCGFYRADANLFPSIKLHQVCGDLINAT